MNKKKHFTLLTLGLPVIPFTFYELKGPFGIPSCSNFVQLDDPIDLLDENSEYKRYNCLCIYNDQTGYAITAYLNSEANFNLGIRFLKGEINDISEIQTKFMFSLEKPGRTLVDSTDPLKGRMSSETQRTLEFRPVKSINPLDLTSITIKNDDI